MRRLFLICFCVFALSTFVLTAQSPHLVLVTGCGRSGTTFIATFLAKNKLDVRHESLGKDGCASWFMATDPSIGAQFRHIFHQVRHPIHVIASVTTFAPTSWAHICKSIPEIHAHDSLIVKATKYWIYWNQKAEKRAEWTYRIENLSNELNEMSRRLGVTLDRSILQKLPSDINTRNHLQLTWGSLRKEVGDELYSQVVAMSRKYGYLE